MEFYRGVEPDNEVANGMSPHEVTGIHEAHVTPDWLSRVKSQSQLVFDKGGLVGGGGHGVNNWATHKSSSRGMSAERTYCCLRASEPNRPSNSRDANAGPPPSDTGPSPDSPRSVCGCLLDEHLRPSNSSFRALAGWGEASVSW